MMVRLLVILCIFLVYSRCATPSAPTGGPRDATPPELVKTNPSNFTTRFQSDKIEFYFNEYVTIAPNFVKITPAVEDFKVTFKKECVTIDFKEELRKNTTYQINFSNKLVDKNEGNAISSLVYVFSTGEYIDSLKVSGRVKSANANEQIPANTYALLYKSSSGSDSLFQKTRPDYFSPVLPVGDFEIGFLSKDTFDLFLLTDNNLNYFYDLPTESIGFTKNKVVSIAGADSFKQNLVLFMPEPEKLKISTNQRKTQNRKITLELNKTLTDSEQLFFTVKNAVCKTFTKKVPFTNNIDLYFHPECVGSQKVIIYQTDSVIIDSIQITVVDQPFKPEYVLPDFIYSEAPTTCIEVNAMITGIFDSTEVVFADTLNKSRIATSITSSSDFSFCFDNAILTSKQVKLIVKDSALLYHNQYYNDSMVFRLPYLSNRELSTLTLNFENADSNSHYIVYLLDEKKNKIKRIYIIENQVVVLDKLIPNTYYLEIVEDKNKNGIRDMGSFKRKELPERQYIDSKHILLKANWEVEHTINLKSFN